MAVKLSRKQTRALSLLTAFHDLRKNHVSCDFEVRIDGEIFEAHRSVLIASSDYFKAMLRSDMQEAKQGYVEIKGLKVEAVKCCLEYLYTGEVEFDYDSMEHLLNASNLMQILEVKDVCFEYLISILSVDNCLSIHSYSKKYVADEGINAAEKFIAKNYEKLIETTGYQELAAGEMQFFLKFSAGKSSVVSWKAVVNWVKYDQPGRTEKIFELLKLIPELDLPTALNVVLKDKIVADNSACLEYIVTKVVFDNMESLKQHMTVQNCFDINSFCDRYEANEKSAELRLNIFEFMNANFEDIVKQERLVELEKDDLVALLDSERNRRQPEQVRWEAVLKWAGKDRDSRSQHFTSLFVLLNLKRFTPEFIQNEIRSNSLVLSSGECKDLIMDALFHHTKSQPREKESLALFDTYQGTIYAYNQNRDQWITLTKDPSLIGGKILSANGVGFVLKFPEIYRVENDGTIVSLPSYSGHDVHYQGDIGTAVALKNCIYHFQKDSEFKFDTLGNQWTHKNVNYGIEDASIACATSRKIFWSERGISYQARKIKFRSYDPVNNICARIPLEVPHLSSESCCTAFEHALFLSGCNPSGNVELQCYNPLANTWTQFAIPQNATKLVSSIGINEELYVAGYRSSGQGYRNNHRNDRNRNQEKFFIEKLELGNWNSIPNPPNAYNPKLVGLKIQS